MLLKEKLSNNNIQYDKIFELIQNKKSHKGNILLISFKGAIIPVDIKNISLFYLENEMTFLITFEKEKYTINKSLEEIENMAGDDFYRVNRQYLINRRIVKKVQKYSEGQYSIHINSDLIEKVYIRRNKVPEFYNWLSNK